MGGSKEVFISLREMDTIKTEINYELELLNNGIDKKKNKQD